MKILLSAYACEPGRGSEPGVGWNWALGLARRGHDVWVLTRSNNRAVIEQELTISKRPELANLHFLYYDVPKWACWWKKGGRGVHLYYALWQHGVTSIAKAAHKQCQFDLVHHITFGGWRQPSYLYRLRIPMIFGPVGGGESGTKSLVKSLPIKNRIGETMRSLYNWLSLLNPFLLTCIKYARSVSKTPETSTWVKRAGGTGHVAMEIGIDTSSFNGEFVALNDGRLRCLFAGRLLGWKGVHLALLAIAGVYKQGRDITLTIVGDGPMKEYLLQLAQKLGINDRVKFIDWLSQPELFQQYREHDLLLFPSLHDSSGNVILEAFAHGLPVVCFKLGGPGVLVDNSCGRAVDVMADDVDTATAKLADALLELADSSGLRAELGQGARRKAERSTWDVAVSSIYDDLI